MSFCCCCCCCLQSTVNSRLVDTTDTPLTRTAAHTCIGNIANNKGRTIRKLIGGGGGAKYKKNIAQRKFKWKKKTSCTPINPKKYSCYGLKKNSYKEFDNEKKIPPPHNFSNGPSLLTTTTQKQSKDIQLLERAMYIVRPYTHEKAKKFFSFKPFRSPVQFSSIFLSHYSQ